MDVSLPHSRQRAIQARDSASIDCAQARGTIDVTSLWMRLTASLPPIARFDR
jgi:hypothetical protein